MSNETSGNVVALLQRQAQRVPERLALVMPDGETVTFAGLWHRACRVSAGLVREGFAPGERAIVMVPMSIDLYAVLLGLLKMGGVAVFVDPWIGRRQIANFASFAEPSAYIGIAKSHLLRLSDKRLRMVPLAVTVGRRIGPLPARRTLAEIEGGEADAGVFPATADAPGLITFTTGSSGTPKGADRTHGFLAAQHAALCETFPYEDGDVDMPMFPVFALNNLAWGITSVVPGIDFRRVAQADGAAILRQMADHGVTTCTASPPFFDRLADALDANEAPRPALRRILTGGAPVSDAQLERWCAHWPDVEMCVVYGSTEAEPVAHIDASERLTATSDVRPETPGYCVGRPINRIRAKVIPIRDGAATAEDLATAISPGDVGELVVAGDHVCKAYYRNPEATAANKVPDADGVVWHRMGDTGYFDGEGRFWLAGRVHSTVRRGDALLHAQLVAQAASATDTHICRCALVRANDDRAVLALELAPDAPAGLPARVGDRLRGLGMEVDAVHVVAQPLPLDPRHNSKINLVALRAQLDREGFA